MRFCLSAQKKGRLLEAEGLALSGLEATLELVDDIDAAFPPDHPIGPVATA